MKGATKEYEGGYKVLCINVLLCIKIKTDILQNWVIIHYMTLHS